MNKDDFQKASIHQSITPGEALKMLRELQGMSQNQLAELTGINQSNISAIENGVRQVGRDTAIAFARALSVHPSVILFPDFSIDEAA
jgi:transcriptional regulator with XRE-family HTH domain